ncbi:chlorinating enzyme [Paenibacillus phyllosphaerae]|uniref:Chlorinating enzyme n=1 Tax=Paenibacillus phyllosphaerae TaxID=274593 RepID=A0A7W5FKB7_9BACL|nr:phytanoyl-CoA dioxygenase family protein [Paenibacillus phyllosphaerae]MBB3107995.1 chlorinating enzyme [Paenibacillus phyllosphaerae]
MVSYSPQAKPRANRYYVQVEQYKQYHRDGFVKVEGLIDPIEIERYRLWAERLRIENEAKRELASVESTDPLKAEFAEKTRVHMISRQHREGEELMLHPRVLDVLEALVGPDVYALQSMLFFNPPGRGGQGWHQDAYYIKTHPDTLVGAWIALEDADEENGCLWVAPGSNHEPIYPPESRHGGSVHAEGAFADLHPVSNVSHLDDEVNTLAKVVANYPPPISVPMKPGDVLFFHSHLFHRSFPNRTADRFRRSYVCHYCNARSFVPWDHDGYEGESGNYRQILARGRTNLPYAEPQFGTEVSITQHDETMDSQTVSMMGMEDGNMMPIVDKKTSH